jgi:hypothetical protein
MDIPRNRLLGLTALICLAGATALVVPAVADPLPTPTISIDSVTDVGINQNATITFHISNPVIPGETVHLDNKALGLVWGQVATVLVDGTSTATATVKQSVVGTYSDRIRVDATADHGAATSGTAVLKVVNNPPPPPTPPTSFTCGGEVPLEAKPGGGTWSCVFNDEFEDGALNPTYWSAQTAITSGPSAHPACFGTDGITVTGGQLHLAAKVLPAPVQCGTSSTYSQMVGSQVWNNVVAGNAPTFSQTYGRYEVEARLPALHGTAAGTVGLPEGTATGGLPGLQETFWLWPNTFLYGPEPISGEMDFAEFYSGAGNVNVPAMHYLGSDDGAYGSCNLGNPGDFNTYVFDWSPGTLTTYVDGTLCKTVNYNAVLPLNAYGPFDKPFYLTLTQAFGIPITNKGKTFDNTYPTPAPGDSASYSTDIKYVRVWH